MDDLLVIIIKLIMRWANSRSDKAPRPVTANAPAPPPRLAAVQAARPGARRPLRSRPTPPTKVAPAQVARPKNLIPQVVVAPARRDAGRSLMGILRSRQELAEAMVLTELIGPPAALHDNADRPVGSL